ncbi:MAG: hypothetical protein ABW106_14185 [Steroidobacteraceae bacterium]
MNNSSNNPHLVVVFAIAGIAFGYGESSLAYDLDEELLAMDNEFEIGNGESKVIADHKTPEPYRVCVKKGQDSVPVKARYDGHELIIDLGSCSDLVAKRIVLSPAGKLKDDAVLLGKYQHVKS